MRDEATGYVRHAAMMLAKGAEQLREEWEDEDTMLSPTRVAELGQLLGEVRRHTKAVATIAKEFDWVASARKLITAKI